MDGRSGRGFKEGSCCKKGFDKNAGEYRQIWDLLEEDLKKNEGSSNHFLSFDPIRGGSTLADLFLLSSRVVHRSLKKNFPNDGIVSFLHLWADYLAYT